MSYNAYFTYMEPMVMDGICVRDADISHRSKDISLQETDVLLPRQSRLTDHVIQRQVLGTFRTYK